MQTRKLEIACPTCGSRDVFYSCEPKCCFNHVCENCRTTFEPVTRPTGARRGGILAPDPLPSCTEPAVACAKCESTAVYGLPESEGLVCAQCGAELTLELTEIAPG
jgi:DNA-directed RNA polymerase subunit RPC12/RpoP